MKLIPSKLSRCSVGDFIYLSPYLYEDLCFIFRGKTEFGYRLDALTDLGTIYISNCICYYHEF